MKVLNQYSNFGTLTSIVILGQFHGKNFFPAQQKPNPFCEKSCCFWKLRSAIPSYWDRDFEVAIPGDRDTSSPFM